MNMLTSCVNEIPDGINIAIGEPVADGLTCFCSVDLCNDEHFCNDCVVDSTSTDTTGKWTTDTTTPDWTATTTRTTGNLTTTTTNTTGDWTTAAWTTYTTTPDWFATTTRTTGNWTTTTTNTTGEWTTATWTTDTTTPDWTATTTRTTADQTTTVLFTTYNPIDGCPYGWVNSLEGCFLFHHEVNTTWRDAQEECEWLGGFLAEPKSEEQIKLLVRKSLSYKNQSS
jgi:hypothetical protein